MQPDATPGRPGGTAAQRTGRSSLPDQRTLLSWLFLGRVALAIATLVAAALIWTETPDVSFIISVTVLLALVITAYGAWHVFVRDQPASRRFLFVQALVDVALVTTLVHLAGPRSVFPALYVLVVAAYAVLMPLSAGIAITLLATAAYLTDAIYGVSTPPNGPFWAQVVVFNVVFIIVAILGHRLRQAGMEQHTLESELRRVRLEADDILHNIRSGVLTVDGLGRLAFINPTAQRLLQLDGDQLMGRPVLDELKQRSTELWAAMVAGTRHGRKVSRGEGFVAHDGGRMFPIGLSTTTFQQETQQAPSVTAIFTDISDLKQLQELHLRAERLEAVAELSASLAHEIRNPLASIRSAVEQLARGQQAGEDERVLAGLIVRESDRLTRLLGEFLDFSRVRATKFEPVDLHTVASAAVRMVRQHPDSSREAELTLEGERSMLEGDEDLLHRVVANLTLNAVQAAAGGPVNVTVRVGPVTSAEMPHGIDLEHGVRLQVSDNGPGIPEEIRERLFQPFVSARPGGSGLGLAIVQRAVEAHRGLVYVESAPGSGTTFTIYLPATWVAEDAA
jgi:two-component system, NtrC family, sensor histidine kinase PilS